MGQRVLSHESRDFVETSKSMSESSLVKLVLMISPCEIKSQSIFGRYFSTLNVNESTMQVPRQRITFIFNFLFSSVFAGDRHDVVGVGGFAAELSKLCPPPA